MKREDMADLTVFLAVAEERSFTRAAVRLGTSQATLSFTVRRLEERLGVRLLTRTTRSVAPTAAGESLLEALRPALAQIDGKLATLTELRDKPAGTVRIATSEHAAETILWPVLERLAPKYPDIKVEIVVDQALTNIVLERFDAGIRLGEQVERDMIAVQVGARPAHGSRGQPRLLRQPPDPASAAGPHQPCLHHHAPAHGGRPLRLGVREGRARTEGPRGRTVGAQHRDPSPQGGSGESGPCLCAGRQGGARPR